MLGGLAAADSIPGRGTISMRAAARSSVPQTTGVSSPSALPLMKREAVAAVAVSNPLRQLYSPQNMKEFMPDAHGHVFHGSCQQLAALGALHAVDPANWPMDGATLGTIVHWTIDHGLASASGASAPRAMRAYFSAHGILYQEYPVAQLDAVIDTYGGRFPIIVEYTQAHNLPGDEQGVFVHYHCIVGVHTTDKSVRAVDGDNILVRAPASGYGPLCVYSRASLHAASPCNIMLVRKAHMIDLNDPDVAKYYQSDAAGWKCKQTGYIIHTGSMLDFYRTMPSDKGGLHDLGLVLSDEIPVSGSSAKVQVYERGALAYDPQRQVDDPPGVDGDVYLAHVDKGVAHDWLKAH